MLFSASACFIFSRDPKIRSTMLISFLATAHQPNTTRQFPPNVDPCFDRSPNLQRFDRRSDPSVRALSAVWPAPDDAFDVTIARTWAEKQSKPSPGRPGSGMFSIVFPCENQGMNTNLLSVHVDQPMESLQD